MTTVRKACKALTLFVFLFIGCDGGGGDVSQDDGETEAGREQAVTSEVSISGGSAVTEGGVASFTITAYPAPSAPLRVNLDITQSGDFVVSGALGEKTVTVPVTGSVDYTVSTADDEENERSGLVGVTVKPGEGYIVVSAPGDSATVTVNDDDVTSEVSISGGSAVTEGGVASFTITAYPAPSAPLRVNLDITQSGDFVVSGALGEKTVTVPVTGSVDYTVSTADDEENERSGLVGVTVKPGEGYIVVSAPGDSATVTVNDDDVTSEVSISGSSAVTEGGVASFTITAYPAPSAPLRVNLDITQSGDFVVSGALGEKTVTVPVTGSVDYTVSTADDEENERSGLVGVTVKPGEGYIVVSAPGDSATVTVNDDDRTVQTVTSEISISGSSAVTEGGVASFTITAYPAPSAPLRVNLDITQSGDFVVSGALGKKTVTVPKTGSASYTVSTVDDSVDEANGSVTATVSTGGGYDIAPGSSATVTVNDDDVTPEISISGSSAVTEGGMVTFTVTANPAPSAPLRVNLDITQSGDFVVSGALGKKTVTVPKTGSASYTVSTVDDSVDEANGSVTATVSTGGGYTVGMNDSATVTVNDDDVTPEISISGSSAVTEGGMVTFTVTANPAPSVSLQVSLDLVQRGDFVVAGNLGEKTVTVPKTGSASYTVSTVDDSADEANGSVTATVRAGGDYTVGTNGSATVTVNDDDLPEISISGSSAVTEGGMVTFTVTASSAPSAPLQVNLDIAQSGDFVVAGNLGEKTVTVPMTGSASYTVSTVDDSVNEANGSVTATVRAGGDYTVGTNGSATVTVNDDDPPTAQNPDVSISGSSAVREGGTVTFTVTASPAPAASLRVNIDIAQSGNFVASGDVGEKSVSVPMTASVDYKVITENDGNDEAHGSVVATVLSGEGYTVGTDGSATVAVNDNDDPVPSRKPVWVKLPAGFSISYYSDNVLGARSLAMGSQGTLFVGTRTPGRVYALTDTNGDNHAEEVRIIAQGLNNPNGVAFRDGDLYVAEINRILRYDDIESNLDSPPAPVVITDSFPKDMEHGWKFIRFGPDGKLYVPVGAPCDICSIDEDESNDVSYAAIMRMDTDGSNLEVFARGIRNTVGFDWHPTSNHLWFTENARDGLGDNIPPDELNRAPNSGLHFGFPYCYGTNTKDPNHGSDEKPCSGFTDPEYNLPAHVVPLGMRFYTGSMFPASYRNKIFIAERGSIHRSSYVGYKVTTVGLNAQGEVDTYEVFADMLLVGVPLGRPVDVLVAPDGALLVSDGTHMQGVVYRISYP